MCTRRPSQGRSVLANVQYLPPVSISQHILRPHPGRLGLFARLVGPKTCCSFRLPCWGAGAGSCLDFDRPVDDAMLCYAEA